QRNSTLKRSLCQGETRWACLDALAPVKYRLRWRCDWYPSCSAPVLRLEPDRLSFRQSAWREELERVERSARQTPPLEGWGAPRMLGVVVSAGSPRGLLEVHRRAYGGTRRRWLGRRRPSHRPHAAAGHGSVPPSGPRCSTWRSRAEKAGGVVNC